MKELAEYVRIAIEKARRQNPNLIHLDGLADLMPSKRMVYWPYLYGKWDVE